MLRNNTQKWLCCYVLFSVGKRTAEPIHSLYFSLPAQMCKLWEGSGRLQLEEQHVEEKKIWSLPTLLQHYFKSEISPAHLLFKRICHSSVQLANPAQEKPRATLTQKPNVCCRVAVWKGGSL